MAANRKRSGTLDAAERNAMSERTFAFPRLRKEPLNDASHVRNAIARFDQVRDASDEERDEAFRRIKRAAKRHGVEMTETSWHELGKPSRSSSPSSRSSRSTRSSSPSASRSSRSTRSSLSRDDLYAEAKRRNIRGRSAMNKAELVQALGAR